MTSCTLTKAVCECCKRRLPEKNIRVVRLMDYKRNPPPLVCTNCLHVWSEFGLCSSTKIGEKTMELESNGERPSMESDDGWGTP